MFFSSTLFRQSTSHVQNPADAFVSKINRLAKHHWATTGNDSTRGIFSID